MKQEIKLGDRVRCIHTGFTGVAVSRTEFINGCIQWGVLPKLKDGKTMVDAMPQEVGIDEGSLEVIKTKKKKVVKRESGGAITRNLMRRNF